MDLVNSKNWYAIYARTRWEKKVARQLSQKGIEHYCPLVRVERQWSDRKKIIFEPLFSSYIFVRVDEKDHSLIRQLDGVVNFVFWLNKPAMIRTEEIETIKSFLAEHDDRVVLERILVNLNDQVRVLSGPLMEREGQVVEVRSRTLKVLLPSLGFALVAELDKVNVQVVTSYANSSVDRYADSGRHRLSI